MIYLVEYESKCGDLASPRTQVRAEILFLQQNLGAFDCFSVESESNCGGLNRNFNPGMEMNYV